jgi:hypothetical protein
MPVLQLPAPADGIAKIRFKGCRCATVPGPESRLERSADEPLGSRDTFEYF